MHKRILVPLDGSQTAEKILSHVRQFTSSGQAEVHLAHVCARSDRAETLALSYLGHLLELLEGSLSHADCTVLTGRPDREIINFAVEQNFDLIALTTHGRTGIKKIMYGSLANALLRTSPVPLYLSLPHMKPEPLRNILVPLDGSHRAQSIIPLVSDLARMSDARVTLLVIGPTALPVGTASGNVVDVQDILREAGIPADVAVRNGDPAKIIHRVARSLPADLIALSTHGRSGLQHIRFGSVTEKILRSTPVPLLVQRTACVPRRHKLLFPKRYKRIQEHLAQRGG